MQGDIRRLALLAHGAGEYSGSSSSAKPSVLTNSTVRVLQARLAERGRLPADPLFPTRRGTPLSRGGILRIRSPEDGGHLKALASDFHGHRLFQALPLARPHTTDDSHRQGSPVR